MSAIRGLMHRLRVFVDPDGYAREVEREIRFHIDRDAMQHRSSGFDDAGARLEARRRFGNVTYVREEVRRMSGMDRFDRIRQNLSYAARGLRRSPGFTAAVVLTLALGLGVNAAMFTFLDRVFVRPPAGVAAPGELRRIYGGIARKDEPNGRLFVPQLWYPQVAGIRRQIDSGTAVALFRSANDSVVVKVGNTSSTATRGIANTDYFRVAGVRPQLGRFFDRDEDLISNPASVAVISDAMWHRVFAGDPGVVGRQFLIKYRPITVIGVGPKDFTGVDLDRTDFWMPLGNASSGQVRGQPWWESYLGKFAVLMRFPDAAAEQRFLHVASQLAPAIRPVASGDSVAEVLAGPIQASLGPARAGKEVSISIRLGGVALIVLLITLANVSNLLLVRATRREREIAIRRALGVSRKRLFEQLLTESVLLAMLGGAAALLFAVWMGAALRGLLLPEIRWPTGVLDLRVAGFAGAAALLTGVVVGVVPAVHAWRPDLLASLRTGGKSGAYRASRLRTGLLVAQAALSVVLLVGSGLFVRSLQNVRAVDVGFDFERTHVSRVIADTGSLAKEMTAVMPVLLERLAAIPGVEAVASASAGPMLGESYGNMFLPGRDSLPRVFGQSGVSQRTVSAGYFRAAGQRIVAGREFMQGDPPSLVVSQELASAYWPGESPLGKCIIVGQTRSAPCLPVVGVTVTTNRFAIVNDMERLGQVYLNAPANPFIVMRIAPGRRAQVASLVSAEVRRLVPRAMIVQMRPMPEIYDYQFRPWRIGAVLFTAMGVLALVVAGIGVYSVIAYATGQRANEMGIRIALGARVADIVRLVIGDGLRTVVAGIVVGLGLALAAGRLVASLLYGISPRDPAILSIAALVLAAIGLAACAIPALRAARVDPVTSLRAE